VPPFKRLTARRKEQRRNDFPKEFNWHALRHFAISCWIDAGLPPKTLQTFAGHSSLQVTMDRYGHLFRSDSHGRAMDAIAEIIDAPSMAKPMKNAYRKWSDFTPGGAAGCKFGVHANGLWAKIPPKIGWGERVVRRLVQRKRTGHR
jgi:Phage integrase family